jgi:aminopeptidase N
MKLKTLLSVFTIGFFSMLTFSQGGHHCSRVKSQGHADMRSDRLSDHYIDLTNKYNVHFYKLDLNIERTSIYVDGSVEMHVEVLAPVLDSLVFELWDDLWIDDILLNGTTAIPFSREESAVIVPVDYAMGDHFFIEVIYEGSPPSGGGPLGNGGMNNDSSPSWGNQVTWSLSEPFAAYEWFPCKQSLTDKIDSVYTFITTNASNMAGSNGLLTDIVDVGPSKKRYEWKTHYPIDYYLISIAVAEYVEYTIYAEPDGADPIMVQNFIYNNPDCLPYFEDDIDETVDYLELYSELYGLYPFAEEKYGHCMAPLSGGMEHQTMTTQGYFVPFLTAHELGHQWFGDNVTCASWSDIWLNEGFASYSEELMFAEYYPGEENVSMDDRHDNIMSSDGGSVWVEDSLNVTRIFSGRLTYDKGAAIVHTLRFLIDNDEQFFDILQTYQSTYGGSTAQAADFKAIAESISGKDFTAFFNEWYYGEGFPTYKIEYTVTDGELIVLLEQDVSMEGVTPFFTNDVAIRVLDADGEYTTFRLTGIDGEISYHAFAFEGDVDAIALDSENWIINQYDGASENNNIVNLVENNVAIEVYPNPTTDQLTIKNGSANGVFMIYDAIGRNVLSGVLTASQQIDVTALSPGQYVLKVDGGQSAFTKQ